MGATPIPEPDINAALAGKGMMSQSYGRKLVTAINNIRSKGGVMLPPQLKGFGKFLFSDENWFLDLTNINFGAAGVGSSKIHPFEVVLTDAVAGSYVMNPGLVLEDESDIGTEILLEDAFTLAPGDWVWLETVFDYTDGTITSCTPSSGASWASSPALYAEETDPWITRIAIIAEDGSVDQRLWTNLVAAKRCIASPAMPYRWTLVPGA